MLLKEKPKKLQIKTQTWKFKIRKSCKCSKELAGQKLQKMQIKQQIIFKINWKELELNQQTEKKGFERIRNSSKLGKQNSKSCSWKDKFKMREIRRTENKKHNGNFGIKIISEEEKTRNLKFKRTRQAAANARTRVWKRVSSQLQIDRNGEENK